MLWIFLFFLIILVSAVLAFRSMKDYEEFPGSINLNAPFYVGNPTAFNEDVLTRIHNDFLEKKQFFSIEKLIKGREEALAIFGPVELKELLPELKLVEIEDYLGEAGSELLPSTKTVSVNQAYSWLIDPKSNLKNTGAGIKSEVKENQKIFLQAVCIPEEGSGKNFQCTIRVMVVDVNPIERVALAKKTAERFEQITGLRKLSDAYTEQKKFTSFQQRSLIPKEVAPFYLSVHDLRSLFSVG